MKLLSWNVNGIRAITQKNFIQDILAENPDIFCLQETKATAEQTLEATNEAFKDYHFYGNEAEKKGYSGTAIFSKTKALNVFTTIGKEEHDNEGRIVGLEFDKCLCAQLGIGVKTFGISNTMGQRFFSILH